MWPPNNPDLNSVDYVIGGLSTDGLITSTIYDSMMKQAIVTESGKLSHHLVDRAIGHGVFTRSSKRAALLNL